MPNPKNRKTASSAKMGTDELKELTVKQELTHGPVHALKRYMVEKKGASNPK